MYQLQANDLSGLQDYLHRQEWLEPSETISKVEKPGEGNMNLTLRVSTTAHSSFILKQSRPFVEKYPQVAAPEERVLQEHTFYRLARQNPTLASFTPAILGMDETNRVMMLEDLGEGRDFTGLYQGQSLETTQLAELIHFLLALHGLPPGNGVPALTNRDMRALNHQHIFILPFQVNNGFNLNDITPGLAKRALPLQKNARLRRAAASLGQLYLEDGQVLLHGDYFPGSWLHTGQGIKIIDPEFGFYGYPEFDVAVMYAHLKMAGQPQFILDKTLELYRGECPLRDNILWPFVGVEILRRLMGLAQLPLSLDLPAKDTLMHYGAHLLLDSDLA